MAEKRKSSQGPAPADCEPCDVRDEIVHIMTKTVALYEEPGHIEGPASVYDHDAKRAFEVIDSELGYWSWGTGAYGDQMYAIRCAVRDMFHAERVASWNLDRLRQAYNLVSTELQDVFHLQNVPGVVSLVHAYLRNVPDVDDYHGCLEMINMPLIRRMFQLRHDGVVSILKSVLESMQQLDATGNPRAECDHHRIVQSRICRMALHNEIMDMNHSVTTRAGKYWNRLDSLSDYLCTRRTACGHRD